MRRTLVILGFAAALSLPPAVALAQSPYFFPHGKPPRGRTLFDRSWKPRHAPLNEAVREDQWPKRHYGYYGYTGSHGYYG